jgi:lipopolysaccharide biosynthesis glycosyltransferase
MPLQRLVVNHATKFTHPPYSGGFTAWVVAARTLGADLFSAWLQGRHSVADNAGSAMGEVHFGRAVPTGHHMTPQPKPQSDRIAIAFGADTPYTPHLAAVIASIVARTPADRIHFLVLHDGMSAALRQRVEACAPRALFSWHDVGTKLSQGLDGSGHISRATYYRLLLPTVAPPELGKILYLDSDIVVHRDLTELWNVRLGEHPLAAVFDVGVDAREFSTRWQLPYGGQHYFNAGILLLNLDLIRAESSFGRAMDLLEKHRERMTWMDQDALNVVFWGRWLALDPRWNVQRNMLFSYMPWYVDGSLIPERKKPFIVHFTTDVKPWLPNTDHPYAWLYWRALAHTPFFADVLAKSGYSLLDRLRMRLRWLKRLALMKA